jgi:hypothetical protein
LKMVGVILSGAVFQAERRISRISGLTRKRNYIKTKLLRNYDVCRKVWTVAVKATGGVTFGAQDAARYVSQIGILKGADTAAPLPPIPLRSAGPEGERCSSAAPLDASLRKGLPSKRFSKISCFEI